MPRKKHHSTRVDPKSRRVLKEGEECPPDWLRPRTRAGINELKKRNDRIRKVIELIDDEFTRDVVKKVVEENLVELPW